MDELTAAAAVMLMAMAVDDFGEEDFEQYSPHETHASHEAQPPAAEAVDVDDVMQGGSTASCGPGIANPKVPIAPSIPLRMR